LRAVQINLELTIAIGGPADMILIVESRVINLGRPSRWITNPRRSVVGQFEK
jgi:hypothetical protein